MKLYIYLILFAFIFSDDLKNIQVLDITSNREMKKYFVQRGRYSENAGKVRKRHQFDSKIKFIIYLPVTTTSPWK